MKPDRRIPRLVGGAALASIACACSGGSQSGDAVWRGTIERHGDTIVVHNEDGALWGGRSPVVLDSVDLFWQSAELERPGALVMLDDDRILVADRYRLHVVSPERGLVRTIGTRSGEGPGEFSNITAVGLAADTILVYDRRTLRMSYLDSAGRYLDGHTVPMHRDFVNPTVGVRLHPHAGAVIIPAGPNIDVSGKPMPGALLHHALGSDTISVLRTVDGGSWEMSGDYVFERQLFGARPIFAVGSGGRIAHGDGLEYCVMIEVPAIELRRVCRTWTRVAVTDAVRDPPIADIAQRVDFPEERQQLFRLVHREQEIPELRPSYDRLMFDEASRLWVRTIDESQAGLHPTFLNRYAELRPPHYRWDVYSQDGRRLGEVRLPSRFEPRLITEGAVYGVYELETGELALGRVILPRGVMSDS